MSLEQKHEDISLSSVLEQMNSKVRAATAAEIAAYTGTRGEIVYDTTNDVFVAIDGSNAGGSNLANITVMTRAANAAITGFAGRMVYTSDTAQIYVHDGSTRGGKPLGALPAARLRITSAVPFADGSEVIISWDEDTIGGIAGPDLVPLWLGLDKTFTTVDQPADTAAVTTHGKTTGQGPYLLTTSGALPTGLATSTSYWLIVVDANTIQFASSYANAIAGTAIDLTGAGSGTQTIEGAGRIGIPAGVSVVNAAAACDFETVTANTDASKRAIRLRHNDATAVVDSAWDRRSSYIDESSMSVTLGAIPVSIGDAIEVSMFHNGGSETDILTDLGATWMSVQVVS